MNNWKKIANRKWEEAGSATSCSISKHGLGKAARRVKKYYNRLGKRGAAKIAFADQD